MQLNFLHDEPSPATDQLPLTINGTAPRKLRTATAHTVQTHHMADTPAIETDSGKAPQAFRTISEAASLLEVPQHVLRFWESRFPQIKPLKRSGGRRFYRPQDMELLVTIKHLLYKQGYTIKGAKKALSQKNVAVKTEIQSPVAEEKTLKAKAGLSEKQHSQLSVLRHELLGLRDALKPYLN